MAADPFTADGFPRQPALLRGSGHYPETGQNARPAGDVRRDRHVMD